MFVPDAAKTGRYDLRADSYVRELTADGADGSVKSRFIRTPTAISSSRTQIVFILACGAVESARLLLLSQSARFPNGLANGSDLVGRNVTFHEYSAAVGTVRRSDLRVGRVAATSAPPASSSTNTTKSAGIVSGGHIACAGRRHSLAYQLAVCRTRRPGALRLSGTIATTFNHSHGRRDGSCTTCRSHDNRVELDDERERRLGSSGGPRHSDVARERS